MGDRSDRDLPVGFSVCHTQVSWELCLLVRTWCQGPELLTSLV